MKRWVPWAVGLAVVLGFGTLALVHARGSVASHRPRLGGFARAGTTVTTAAATRGTFTARLSLTGTVAALDQVQVVSQAAGGVGVLSADIGQKVRAGQMLARVDDSGDLEQQLAAAQASLAQAGSQLGTMLDPSAGIAPAVVQEAQARVEQAQAALGQAEAKLQADQLTVAADSVASAPVAGTVQAVNVIDGQQVTAGAPIAVLVPASAPQVDVPVPEQELPYLPVGTEATVAVPSAGATYDGQVSAVSQVAAGSVSQVAQGRASLSQASAQPAVQGNPLLGGPSASGAQALFTLSVALSGAPQTLLSGATATVDFTPQNDPPAGLNFSDAGTIAYASPLTVSAEQSGTVGDVVAAGTQLAAGQKLATVTNALTTNTLTQDALSVQNARAALQLAQATLTETAHPAPALPAAIAAQRSLIAADQRLVMEKKALVSDLVVRAPFAGIITARDVSVGATVSVGTPLFTLQGTGVDVVVPVPQEDLATVHVGQPASIRVGSAVLAAHVVSVVSATNPQSLTFSAYVAPDPPSAPLHPGEAVSVSITTVRVTDALAVPSLAVQTIGGKPQLFVVRGGVLSLAPVTLGPAGTMPGVQGPAQEILSGIQAGDQVVISDATYLAAGDRVQIANLKGVQRPGPSATAGKRFGGGSAQAQRGRTPIPGGSSASVRRRSGAASKQGAQG